MVKWRRLLRALFILALPLFAAEDPAWFGKDYRSPGGFGFFCSASAEDEAKALTLARAACARKHCQLFAKERDSDLDACRNVMLTGRIERKKLVDCQEGGCRALISHFYPKSEYQKEFERLNQPPISPDFAKNLEVREMDETPSPPPIECEESLALYHSAPEDTRIQALTKAAKECKPDPTSAQKVREYFKLEKERARTAEALPGLKRTVEMYYDSLFGKNGHPAYVTDQASCEKIRNVVREWPATIKPSIRACAGAGKDTKDCRDTDILQLRAQFSGCVCQLTVPIEAQRCTSLMIQALQTKCPMKVDNDCFDKSRAQVSASLGTPLKFKFGRKVSSETLLRSRDLND